MRQLRYESAKLKRLVADLSLDRHILQEIIAKNCKASWAARAWRSGRSQPIRVQQRRFPADVPLVMVRSFLIPTPPETQTTLRCLHL